MFVYFIFNPAFGLQLSLINLSRISWTDGRTDGETDRRHKALHATRTYVISPRKRYEAITARRLTATIVRYIAFTVCNTREIACWYIIIRRNAFPSCNIGWPGDLRAYLIASSGQGGVEPSCHNRRLRLVLHKFLCIFATFLLRLVAI